jgi:Tfp pilus assembly protein PilZ
VTVDSSNNVYVSGYTRGGLDGNTSSGGNDLFLVKFNSDGVKQWTKQLGTSSDDTGSGVTVDSSDNIYVTGRTAGGLDGNTNSGSDCNYPPCSDLILVKYNSSGTKQWTQQLGTSGWDDGQGVTVDSMGNLYVTGETWRGLDGNTNLGGGDPFLVKYNSSGVKQWTKQLGTSSDDYGHGVTVDSSDNIYVTGETSGGLDGNTHSGRNDLFLVKYNSSGTKQWTKQLGTSSRDVGSGVTVDSSDNLYVTGRTEGGLDGNTNSGNNDIFLVKYNSSGTKQWTKQLGTSGQDKGYGVTVDSSDNIYVTGETQGGLDGNTSSGDADLFLVKYNSSGVKQ